MLEEYDKFLYDIKEEKSEWILLSDGMRIFNPSNGSGFWLSRYSNNPDDGSVIEHWHYTPRVDRGFGGFSVEDVIAITGVNPQEGRDKESSND